MRRVIKITNKVSSLTFGIPSGVKILLVRGKRQLLSNFSNFQICNKMKDVKIFSQISLLTTI